MRNLLAITLLGACAAITACSGGGSAPRAAQPAPEPAELIEGDLRIRASAVPTMQLPESVARGYGIERGEDRVLLLVGMRRGTDGNEVALTGTVDARVTDLQSRTQAIPMRALHSGPSTGSGQAPSTGPGEGLVDYIGIIVVTPPETLRFHVQATPQGEPPRTIDFVREFYPLVFARRFAPPGQHFGHGPGPRYLWPREQVFQPLFVRVVSAMGQLRR